MNTNHYEGEDDYGGEEARSHTRRQTQKDADLHMENGRLSG